MENIINLVIDHPNMTCIITVVSVILNLVIGCKPIIMFVVRKTNTTKDDEIAAKIYKILDQLDTETKQAVLDKIK